MSDLLHGQKTESTEPVECLGLTFQNEQFRREHFTKLLADKLNDPEFRKTEGFTMGSDEAILALSDPPYYTACPNPFFEEFLSHYGTRYAPGTNTRHVEPFTADVSEGKNDPIYNAHSYHTKVPHKAIMRYLLHYTQPGDIVLDSFCGTGMMGVAAQLCGDRRAIESMGYRVDAEGDIFERADDGSKSEWRRVSKIGARRPVLNDLSAIGGFIAYNFNTSTDVHALQQETEKVTKRLESESPR